MNRRPSRRLLLGLLAASLISVMALVVWVAMRPAPNLAKVTTIRHIDLSTSPNSPVVLGWSPDSKLLAVADQKHNIELWDVAAGKVLRALEGHSDNVFSLEFSRDGLHLASAGHDNRVYLWNVQSAEILARLGNADKTNALWVAPAFSPDGILLASVEPDGKVRITDVQTGVPLNVFEANANSYSGLAFNADGTLLAISGADGMARLWTMPTATLSRTLPGGGGRLLLFSPDGKFLLTYGGSGVITLWDLTTGQTVNRVRFQVLYGWTFTPDGASLVLSNSGDGANTVWLMEIATGKQRYEIGAAAATFSSDAKLIASASGSYYEDGRYYGGGGERPPTEIWLWDVATRNRQTLYQGKHKILALKFSPDNQRIAFITDDGTLGILDLG